MEPPNAGGRANCMEAFYVQNYVIFAFVPAQTQLLQKVVYGAAGGESFCCFVWDGFSWTLEIVFNIEKGTIYC